MERVITIKFSKDEVEYTSSFFCIEEDLDLAFQKVSDLIIKLHPNAEIIEVKEDI